MILSGKFMFVFKTKMKQTKNKYNTSFVNT